MNFMRGLNNAKFKGGLWCHGINKIDCHSKSVICTFLVIDGVFGVQVQRWNNQQTYFFVSECIKIEITFKNVMRGSPLFPMNLRLAIN